MNSDEIKQRAVFLFIESQGQRSKQDCVAQAVNELVPAEELVQTAIMFDITIDDIISSCLF